MMKKVKKYCLLVMVLALMMGFTACHGSVERSAFEIPEEFDTTQTYEITFWAKNDTNKTPHSQKSQTHSKTPSKHQSNPVKTLLFLE